MELSKTWACSALTVGLFALSAGCNSAPSPERNSSTPRVTLQSQHTEPVENSTAEDCGLTNYPVSRSNLEMLADVRREDKEPPNSSMLAKIALDKDGKITHIRVLRLAHSNAPNWKEINDSALNDIKRGHYKPAVNQGKPLAACADVDLTIDLF